MNVPKLTDAQARVMKWIGKGWTGEPGAGSAVMVNGKRICNVDTMTALKRHGLVMQDELRRWVATAEGKALTKTLDL